MKNSIPIIRNFALLWLPIVGALNLHAHDTALSGKLLVTFTNPIPAGVSLFGYAVAGVGTDKVLVGDPQGISGLQGPGAAYLFSTDGTLITTFTNPTPAVLSSFGSAVAAAGSDKVLIASDSAYLFSTNGALLATFTNPTRETGDGFGVAMATVGTDKVIIGAYKDNTGASSAGTAYLFSTGGTLLTTFTNPTPEIRDRFGFAVAGVGSDKVLVGAFADNTGASEAGAAYLFSTNGTLLTTYTNPTPAVGDLFGFAVAAVGPDMVLIGAGLDNTRAPDSGAAYLFKINGTLLTTFRNPSPATYDEFGDAVAAVGTNIVVIGAYRDNTGAKDAGAAYIFSIDGTLLTTLTNPAPVTFGWFGRAVAAVGVDKVLIGLIAAPPHLFSLDRLCELPVITTQPASQTGIARGNATLSVAAAGPTERQYQWFFNAKSIRGATNESLLLTNLSHSSAGVYHAAIRNGSCSVTSAPANLTVISPVSNVKVSPPRKKVLEGRRAVFKASAKGTPPLGYQWLFSSNNAVATPITGATGPMLVISNASPLNGGLYSVVVSNAANSITTTNAVLAVIKNAR